MALPTLDKTWVFSVNNNVAGDATQPFDQSNFTNDRAGLMLGIKNGLIDATGMLTNEWVVEGSCAQSTVAGSGTGPAGSSLMDGPTDRWTAIADLRCVSASSTAHSWIVLSNAAVGVHMLIDHVGYFPTYGTTFYIYFSFVGFTASGGDGPTDRPVASDETRPIVGSNTANGQFGQNIGAARSWKYHIMRSNDGECTRVVAFYNGNPITFWMIDKPKNPVSGWTTPYISSFPGSNSDTTHKPTYSLLHDQATWTNTSIAGFNQTDNEGPDISLTSEGAGTGGNGEFLSGANDIDGNYPFFPVGIASQSPGVQGRHGEVFDLWWSALGVSQGDTFPGDASRQFAVFGQMIFPWNGSIPLTT